jgi:predicted transglutaminase-like cysteine proteinase
VRLSGSIVCAMAVVVGWASGAAYAAPQKPVWQASIPSSTNIRPQKEARAPIGWTEFCARHASECDVEALPARDLVLDGKAWRVLTRINDEVNAAIEPVTDGDHWNVVERWDYPTDGKGDCEDFVLEKRKRLMAVGIPRQSLLIAVVRDRKGDGHAVLLVKTDRGDYVLDNQEADILAWSETGYGFVKRQSQEHPMRWVGLGEPRPVVAVGNPR